jgi:hypothetical protein
MPTGIFRYIAIGLVALALVAAIVLGVKGCKQIDANSNNQLVNAGSSEQKAADQGEVLNHVSQAQNAVANPSDAERNVVCSRWDRNCAPGNSQ